MHHPLNAIEKITPLKPRCKDTLAKAFSTRLAQSQDMELLRKGSRLSIQRVSEAEWETIMRLAGIAPVG